MKIGIDASMLQVGGGRHGTGSYLRGLIGALAECPGGHEFTLLAIDAGRLDVPSPPEQFPVRIIRSPALGRASALVSHQLALPLLARRLRLDVLHAPGVSVNASMPAIPLRSGVPLVVTVHDMMPLRYPRAILPRPRHRLFYRLMLRACGRAKAVVCDSEATRRDVLAWGGVTAGRLHVVPLAADPFFTPVPARPEDRRADALGAAPFILHVGGTAPTKGLAVLLAAMGDLWRAPRRIRVDLACAGGPAFDPLALAPVAAAHRPRVHVLEAVSRPFLRWLYQNAVCLAAPSLGEGFGLPVVEAMASGCPAVASRAGALPEVGGDAAVYVDPEHASALAEGLAGVIDNPGRRAALRDAGLRRAAEFSWAKTAAATRAVYEAAGRSA